MLCPHPSRAGSTQGLRRQGDPALYRCQSNIFDASRDALLLGARASATLTAAEGRGKHKGLLKQPVAGCLSAPGGDTCREPVLWGSALASWDPWHQLQHGPSPRAQPALGAALPPLASGASLEGLRTVSQIQSNRNRSRFHQQPCPRDSSRGASKQPELCLEGRNASHCLRGTMRGQNVKPRVGRERG